MSKVNHLPMAICNYYQLARMDGNTFSKEHKKLIREKISVSRKHMEFVNAQTLQSGKMYVEDVEATLAYAESVKAEIKANTEAEAETRAATEALTKVLADAKKTGGKKPKAPEENNGTDNA